VATGGNASIRRHIKDCALVVPIISANTQSRSEGYFRLEWKLAVDRSHLMADDHAFLLPVVIDATLDVDARVPDKFRDVQWTHLRGGASSTALAEHVYRLLMATLPNRQSRRRARCRHRARRDHCPPGTAVDRSAAVREPQPQ
jgi:hypothetical protein